MEEAEYEKRRAKRSRKRHMLICLILTLLLFIIVIGLVLYFIVVPLLSKEESLDFRLPTNLVPEYYVLQIHPRLIKNNFTFEGNVSINVICVSSTKKIILHAKDLEILETNIIGSDSKFTIKKEKRDNVNDFLILYTKEELKKNNRYQIQISFSGHLSDDYRGFYWKNYTDDGETKYLAATNFKPIYARRAFPCFDEPALKASFFITIIRSKNENSLSNMRKKSTESREDNLEADIYEPTIKISTYLVGYFIGEFSNTDVKHTNISIWAKSKSTANKIKESLGKSVKLFDKYLEKLHFPSTQNKIDILAIPNDSEEPIIEFGMDSAAGGWGFILMDEYFMHFDDKDHLDRKQIVISKVAHALAHQLFGNIVTPKWWNDAWLSESIATYIEIFEINELYKDWNWINKSTIKLNEYIEEDCSDDSHTISMKIDKPSKIIEQLNSFAVSLKGWRILRMLNYIMGEDYFWEGLSNLIKDKAYGSVNQDEFWDYMTKAQSKHYRLDLKTLIGSWIHNPGHPLITATRLNSSKTFQLSQVSCRKESAIIWKIPITYIDENKKSENQKVDTWLMSTNGNIKTSANNFHWVLINPEQMAFYHVNYDKENWEILASKLADDYESIPAVNRYQLLFDSLYFARKNLSSYENFFNVLTYLEIEHDDNVIEFLAIANLSEIGKIVRRRVQKNWKEYVGIITKRLYERKFKGARFDEKPESYTNLALKKEILNGVCSIDESSCVNLAISKYEDWIKNKKTINRSDRPLIKLFLCTAIRNDSSRWENVENYFHELNGNFPANDLIYALGCIEDQFKLHRILNIGVFDDTQYLSSIFESILDNSNWIVIFDILKSEWNRIQQETDRFKETVKILTEVIANREELAKVNDLYANKKEKMTKNQKNLFERLIKKAEKRISSMDYQLQDMIRWLENRNWKNV